MKTRSLFINTNYEKETKDMITKTENNSITTEVRTYMTNLPGGGFHGGEQEETLPGGGFHGGEQEETLPGGGFHGCEKEVIKF